MKLILKLSLLIFVIIAMSCIEVKQNSEVAQTEYSSTPSIKIDNNAVFISYSSYGEGPLTLLFVHGWSINQTYWSNQVEELSSDYRIVTVDLPGFGESGNNRANWSIEKYGTDINIVIEKLKLTNVILISHSMGGDVILEAALKNEAVLALIGVDNFKDVGIEFNDEIEAEIAGFISILKDNYSETVSAYAEGTLLHTSTDSLVKSKVIKDFKNSDSTIVMSSLESLFKYALLEPKQLSKLRQKLYLINSDASPTNEGGFNTTDIAYQIVDIKATRHFPMIEKPEEFNKLLKETIQKIAENSIKNNLN
jgi:pimeloyl-ACP methyl ester carboxylesterase